MTEAQWLITTACLLIVSLVVSCLVFALASMKGDKNQEVEHLKAQWKHLRDGMKRAGAWKSEYDLPSPPQLRIKDGSA